VLGNGESGGMFHPAVRSDRIEVASAFFHSRDHTKSTLFQSDAISSGDSGITALSGFAATFSQT